MVITVTLGYHSYLYGSQTWCSLQSNKISVCIEQQIGVLSEKMPMLEGLCHCCCCRLDHTSGHVITTNIKDYDMNYNYRNDDNNSMFSKSQFLHPIHCCVMGKERQVANTSTSLYGAHHMKRRNYSLTKSYCTNPRCTASYGRDVQSNFTRYSHFLHNTPICYGKLRVSSQFYWPGGKPCMFLVSENSFCSKM